MPANAMRRDGLVLRWVTVTDDQGRQRTEMRWTATPTGQVRAAMVKAA